IDDVGAGADPEGLADIMVSDEHADAAGGELADDALDIEHRERIDTRERLIEQHESGLGGQRPGDLDPPPLPARERHAERAAHVTDAQLLQQLLETLLARGALEVRARLEDRHHVRLDVELAEHRGLLRQVAEAELRAAVHGQQRHVGVFESDAAGVARHEAHDHVEGGGLAGSVRTEEADHLAARELERQITHDLAGLVALGESRGLKRAHGCAVGLGEADSSLPGFRSGGCAASLLPAPGALRGAMVMCTRSSVPGAALACQRCARTLYTRSDPEISSCPSVSQASSESRTVPSLTSSTLSSAWPRASWAAAVRFCPDCAGWPVMGARAVRG